MVDKIIRKCLASMGPDSIPSHCFFFFWKTRQLQCGSNGHTGKLTGVRGRSDLVHSLKVSRLLYWPLLRQESGHYRLFTFLVCECADIFSRLIFIWQCWLQWWWWWWWWAANWGHIGATPLFGAPLVLLLSRIVSLHKWWWYRPGEKEGAQLLVLPKDAQDHHPAQMMLQDL